MTMPAMTNFDYGCFTTKRKILESRAVVQSQQQQQQQEQHHQDPNQNCKLYIELTSLPPPLSEKHRKMHRTNMFKTHAKRMQQRKTTDRNRTRRHARMHACMYVCMYVCMCMHTPYMLLYVGVSENRGP